MCKYARENNAHGADYILFKFNNTLIKNAKLYNFKRVNCDHINMKKRYYFFKYTTATNVIELAILNQFKKQQTNCFYDFHQYRVFTRLQIVFVVGIKIHKQNLLSELVNYYQLASYLLKQHFCKNIKEHMHKHKIQFRSWETISYERAKNHQVLGC